ncbi:phage major capsid protein [Roseitalea porphyridii]|uniref:Phage major capsid protein n=1 Tax=Roseitalea porphyridii TaxID=1852022 RepID=A0A4P6V147_9HYPH|nr:phage major capsid protein [Roseitalea porphyridii]QBK30090.1 phage major capsid protein [Roseitalea porphyridii]
MTKLKSRKRAPATKAAPAAAPVKPLPASHAQDVAEAFDDFMRAFEAFKQANDERLRELETQLGEDAVSADKVDRINDAVDEQKRVLERLIAKASRPGAGGALFGASGEHKAAFERYVRKGDENGLRRLEGKAMSYGSGPDGGFLVPPETETAIAGRLRDLSPIRALATVRQVTGAVLKKPFATNGPEVGWVGETDARPQTDTATLAELSFPTAEIYAMPAATAMLLEDSAVDIDQWITAEVEAAFAEQEGAAFIAGNGTNKPRGLLDYTKVDETSWSWGNIGYIATGTDADLPADDAAGVLLDTVYALKAGYRQNGNWLMSRKTQAAIRKLKDTDGNYIWQPPATADQKPSLMGFAVHEAEDMPVIGSDSFSIAFGDFARGYLVVDRRGISVLRDPYSAKPYVLFYTTKRVGGGVQDFDAIKLVKFGVS